MKKKLFLFLLIVTAILYDQGARAQITVSGSTGADGTYTSLTNVSGAFQAINGTGQTGNAIVITVTGNSISEEGTNSLNAGAWASLTLYPTGTGYTIGGNIASGPLINLNGADHVTIDGRVNATGSAKDLTLTNTNASNYSGTSTIRLINSAENNVVKYCTVKGSGTSAEGGIIFFSLSSSGNGNDGNLIDHCDLTNDSDNRPCNVVYSYGASDFDNSGNIISNNNIYDFFNANVSSYGIDIIDYSTDWIISGNSFYETTSFVPTVNSSLYNGIYISNTSGYFTITNNYIGGSEPMCNGSSFSMNAPAVSHSFRAINLNVGTSNTTSVQNNVIKNHNVISNHLLPWYGIYINAGNVDIGTTSGNTIGATTGNGSITVTRTLGNATTYGIYIIAGTGTVDVQNNNIGSITTIGSTSYSHSFSGIYKHSVAGSTTISNNLIGSSSTPNSIQASSASTSTTAQNVYGIMSAGTGSVTISGNTIANLYNAYTKTLTSSGQVAGIVTSAGVNTLQNNTVRNLSTTSLSTGITNNASIIGISQRSTTAGQTVSGNTIYDLSNISNSTSVQSVIGIYYSGPASGANAVSQNFIYNLSVSSGSTLPQIHGIKINAGTTTYSNNIIDLGGSITTGNKIYGIYENGGTSNNNSLYFNTVYIGGALSVETSSTYALYNAANTNTRDFRNNILYNARSGGTTGKHYAVYVAGNTGLTIDYNDYLAPGTSGILGSFAGTDKTTLADWKAATVQDNNSQNTNPGLADAGGILACNYIPSVQLTGVTGTGITTDYAGTTRDAAPTMGAYEQSSIWTGSSSSDWNTANNWSNSTVPTASDNVNIPVVSNNPVINQNMDNPAVCNRLTIEPGAVLTLAAGKALTVSGSLVNNSGNTGLVIGSDATGTGSLIHNTDNVNATIQRYITGSNVLTNMMYHLVSVPLSGAASPTSNLFLGSYLFNFSETTNNWVGLGTSTLTPLDVTRGYMLYYPDDNNTYSFAGPVNNGSFTALTTYTDGNGYNLVPNPYPSALDWNAASGWTKTNIGGTIYFWPAGSGSETSNYASLNGSTGVNGGTRYIPVGQAFFVQATGSSELTMNNATRVHNAQPFWKSVEDIPALLSIKSVAQNNDAFDELAVHFREGATVGFDPEFDGNKLQGGADAPQFCSVASDNSLLSINSLPFTEGEVTVPLHFAYSTVSDITFIVSGMGSFNENVPIYLEDRTLGTMVNLRQYPVYTFNYQPGSIVDRFRLCFSGINGTGEPATQKGKAFISNGLLFIDIPGMEGATADILVLNVLGQLLYSDRRVFNGTINIRAPENNGIYILRVDTQDQHFVTKIKNK